MKPVAADGSPIYLPSTKTLLEALRAALLPDATKSAEFQSFLEMPPGLQDVDAASGLQPGANVGPYVLLRSLGAGGMAEVWLARRADGAFKREVALKLPLLRQLRQDLAQRFAVERDILASLEHPNIARLYDAGIDAGGCPYLAMEYVQGQPLTDWCDAQSLGLSDRLKLFLQVLEAVRFAHEKQVIHRDLKPSNILVTPSAQVRLLDFGVAKLLEADEADKTSLTSIYGRALTPDYASPELLRGDLVDVRSDIYSLGVLLYELLTGMQALSTEKRGVNGSPRAGDRHARDQKAEHVAWSAHERRSHARERCVGSATARRFGRHCAQSARQGAIEAISECRGLRGRYRTLPRQKTHPGATRANHGSLVQIRAA